eukprot:4517966-Pleurochrysis_carterae.AAC.1
MPKSSAAGMDRLGSVPLAGVHSPEARCPLRGAAARVSASWTSVGQVSETSHTSPSRPAT